MKSSLNNNKLLKETRLRATYQMKRIKFLITFNFKRINHAKVINQIKIKTTNLYILKTKNQIINFVTIRLIIL